MKPKQRALEKFIRENGGKEEDYLVLTDKEADVKVKEDILNSLWAFNSSFLSISIPDYQRRL